MSVDRDPVASAATGQRDDRPTGAPAPHSGAVRDRFRRQRVRDTAPEMALRRRLHALGLRYRVDHPVLPEMRRRRPDVVFVGARVAVFVDGCFWHRCPEHAIPPRNNASWWAAKLQRTVDRDRDTDRRLCGAGWLSLRVWEHEPPDQAAARVHDVVLTRTKARRGSRRDTVPVCSPVSSGRADASADDPVAPRGHDQLQFEHSERQRSTGEPTRKRIGDLP